MTLIAGTRLDRYQIRSKLGAGGMGDVYLAQDTKLDRKVALKILPAEVAANQERMRRFVQEAKSASALNHPNIITIYEIGETDSGHFIGTEFIDGETLRQRMKSAPLKLGDVLDVSAQIASALSAAHAAGIVHRDIKPENVMLRRDGIVKVLDFGLAKLTERLPPDSVDTEAPTSFKTDPGTVVGTAVYMSPEQARGMTVDERTDIFSLGVVLYEMVAGCLPFAGATSSEVLAAILSEKEPQPLARYSREVPTELERIVSKALRKNRDKRYQTIKDMLLDLQSLKQEAEFEKKLERSASPQSKSHVYMSGSEPIETVMGSATRPTVSERGLTSAITLTQRSAVIAVAALLIIASTVGAYFYFTRGGVIDSIAVLPFQNKSSDADTEYLSDGLAESLIYRLSQLPNLKVSPTSSVFRYKGKETDAIKIGNELGVNAVMSGRMVQRGDNLTISVELVDVQNNRLLWGEQYERKLSDLLATQREIATEITNKLQLKLSGESEQKLAKKYTDSNEAYQLYLKGRFYWNKRDEENLRKAIEQFKAAADKDPNFALAFVGLADSHVLLPHYSSALSNEVLPQAKAYAQRALEIDNSLGEAHSSLGYVNRLLWNWDEAEKELKRGIELNPNYATAHKWYGNYLGTLGRFDEAMVKHKRAQELEPLSLIISENLAEIYLQKGDLIAAFEQCQRAIDLDPNWYLVRKDLAIVYLKQGRNAEALAEAEKGVELSKRQSIPLGYLGYTYAQTGKRSGAAAVVEELKERYAKLQANGYDLAWVYAGLGDKDQAFAWMEKDFQSHNATMPGWLYMPPLDSLRDDPRFKDLARRIGLPELK